MNPRNVRLQPQNHGDVLTAISDGMVALLKEFYGRGPTRTKSYFEDDLVVCVLRGGFSRVEQTLLDGGRGPAGQARSPVRSTACSASTTRTLRSLSTGASPRSSTCSSAD